MSEDNLYTSTEAAKKLGVSRPTLLKWVDEGSIPKKQFRKIGSRTKFRKDYIDKTAQKLESGALAKFP